MRTYNNNNNIFKCILYFIVETSFDIILRCVYIIYIATTHRYRKTQWCMYIHTSYYVRRRIFLQKTKLNFNGNNEVYSKNAHIT